LGQLVDMRQRTVGALCANAGAATAAAMPAPLAPAARVRKRRRCMASSLASVELGIFGGVWPSRAAAGMAQLQSGNRGDSGTGRTPVRPRNLPVSRDPIDR